MDTAGGSFGEAAGVTGGDAGVDCGNLVVPSSPSPSSLKNLFTACRGTCNTELLDHHVANICQRSVVSTRDLPSCPH